RRGFEDRVRTELGEVAVAAERSDDAADPSARLVHPDRDAAPPQRIGGRQACDPGPDDRDGPHGPAMVCDFSPAKRVLPAREGIPMRHLAPLALLACSLASSALAIEGEWKAERWSSGLLQLSLTYGRTHNFGTNYDPSS